MLYFLKIDEGGTIMRYSIGKHIAFHKNKEHTMIYENELFYIDFVHIVSNYKANYDYAQKTSHMHDFFELHLILDKYAIYESMGEEVTLYPGDIIIHPPSFKHKIIFEPEGFSKIYFAFYFSSKDNDKSDFYKFITQELAKPLILTGNNFIKNFAKRMIKIRPSANFELDDILLFNSLSLILEFFKLINSNKEIKINKAYNDRRINEALKYIEENISASLTVDDVANHIHLSTKQFTRIFENTLKISPGNYIKNYRIKVIKNMLMNLDYSVGDIADILGYTNTASLTRMFKRAVNTTPSSYRKDLPK